MLKKEPFGKITPDVSSEAELLDLLKRIYPPNKEVLGIIALELAK